MASPGWMYHPLRGKQLFPDLTPAFQRQLEAENWCDSPEKVSGPQPADASPPPPPAPAKADIRNVGIDDFIGTAPSYPILMSHEALGRMALIIDRDGDRRDADLSVEELDAILDRMSVDEVQAISEHLGFDANATFAPYSATHARQALLLFLRPALGVVIDTRQEPFDMTGAPDAGVQEFNAVVSNAPLRQEAFAGNIIGDAVAAVGTTLAGNVTLSAFMGAAEADRVRWLEVDATKADIARLLDERQIAFKARDSKADLAALLLTSLTNEA